MLERHTCVYEHVDLDSDRYRGNLAGNCWRTRFLVPYMVDLHRLYVLSGRELVGKRKRTMAPSLAEILCSIFTVFCLFSSENSRSWTEAVQMDYEYVTCGSTVKLINQKYNARLHSHDIHYGSGSGQQSVTAVDSTTDKNSYWQIKGKLDKNCVRGEPIKCGSTIRLQHVATKRNLHSHHFQSPLSSNQEVSGFGEEGHGDEGDYWAVICSTTNWKRNEPVRFKHVVTENYLSMSGQTYGRPIHGQKEVCGVTSLSNGNQWRAVEGIYVKPSEASTPS